MVSVAIYWGERPWNLMKYGCYSVVGPRLKTRSETSAKFLVFFLATFVFLITMTVCLCCHSPMHVCYPEDATRLLETGTGGNFGSVFNQLVNSRAIACPFLFMEFHWKSPPNFQPWPWLPLFPRKKSLLGHIAGTCLEWGVRFGWEMAMFDQPELVKKMRCIKRLHMVIYGYM